VYALVDPTNFQTSIQWKEWLIFLPFALLLLPFQTACEEFFFRGLLLQWFHRMMPSVPFVGVILSSVCFGLMHSLNPEVESFGFFSAMGSYMLMGLSLAILAVVDEGLELPSAFHFANNLFSFTILGYTNMVLPSPCLFMLKEPLPLMDYVSTVLIFLVLVLVFCRKQGYQFKVLLKGTRAFTSAKA
jgi:membrane protease YdiL (CAAX protease family)